VSPGLGESRWTSPTPLGLLVGVGGLVIAGPVGGVVGLLAGVAAAHRSKVVLLAAAAALTLTAGITVLEQPLTNAHVPTFPVDHPLAELAAKVAGVLLLGGLAGILAGRGGEAGPRRVAKEVESMAVDGRVPERLPISTIAALLAVTFLAALTLWRLGDRRWETLAVGVAIAVIILAVVLLIPRFRRLLRGGTS
jgi:hypothetical protein